MKSKSFCFVFMGNLYLCPYITKYIEHIDSYFDIIYWNRDGIKEDSEARNMYNFDFKLRSEDSKFKKIKGYLAFKKYAQRILRENSYDGVILLHTGAGIILNQILKKHYFKKYILDIRDYTLEQNRMFYYIEKKVVNASAITVLSSEGYKSFLPPYNYVVTHNNRPIDETVLTTIRNRNKKRDKLVIAFIGYINYKEQHKKLLRIFKNDKRFELHFIGKEAEKLLPYCKKNDINNVKIVGQFPSENIIDYYKDVDIINNLYGNNTPVLDYALSNKLYFAAELYMPILVCEGTFMEQVSVTQGFGYTVDFNDPDVCNKLYKYYQDIDWRCFTISCDEFLHKVNKQNRDFEIKVKKFFDRT